MLRAGFTIEQVIDAHGDTVVSTARKGDDEPVVLKILDSDQPAPEMLARWRHEYALLKELDSEWVIKPRELISTERSLVLVLENFGTQNLAQLIERNVLDLRERLSLAIQLVKALSDVHAKRLVHGDIAPKNVLVDVSRMRLKLCDFGLATRLDQEPRRAVEHFLRGTFDYISPEQTGRTNLAVDYRSDFYSLGVTLYELFSGQRPYQLSDPMALVHAHLAVGPRALQDVAPDLPPTLCAVVHKLLAKSPDERYQSSFGLRYDLERCADSLARIGAVERFPLGTRDIPERFRVAQRLVGREAETEAVLEAFDRAQAGRPELVLVSGQSGIGKTALVAELHRPVLARRGYFLRGKCDQYGRNQPYLALVAAFQPLMQQLAVESEERGHYWRAVLHEALGDQAGAVAEIIPNLRLLLGDPPPLQVLPAAETEQRLHIAFGRFVRALASRAHPLMLFLDDLQWADAPSLRLLEALLTDDEQAASLLVVGAYRDNEVDAGHPLSELMRSLARRAPLTQVQLPPLNRAQVAELLSETLRTPAAALQELVDLCFDKTAGNPFFLGQFLRSLHELGDIHYDREAGAWHWSLERIRGRGMTDNVVELMLTRLQGLPKDTQALLAQAAHLGEGFSLRELMLLADATAADAARTLWPALASGLVLPLGEHYKFESDAALLAQARFRFLHDRVQQAAYELTPPEARTALQLDCGRRLQQGLSDDERAARLFVVLECLNHGRTLINDAAELSALCDLNLEAGLRAKAGSAYAAASRFLALARSLLAADAWRVDMHRAQRVHRELAESLYLEGRFDEAEALYPEVQANCQDPLLRAEMCLVHADQFNIQGRFVEAIPVLRQGLDLVGCPFPASDADAMAAFPADFTAAQSQLAADPQRDWLAAAEMDDPARLLEMRLRLAVSYAAYQSAQFGVFLLNASRMLLTCLAHGLNDLTPIACVAYTTALSAMKQPYTEVHAMGRLAVKLSEVRPNRHYRITVYQYFAPFYQHWGEALQDTLPLLDRAIELGLSGMNPLSTGYCVLLRAVNRFILGEPLEDVEFEGERALRYLQRTHQGSTEAMLRHGVLQPLRALRGRTVDLFSFDTAEFSSSAAFGNDLRTPSIPLAFYSAAWLRHAYLFGAGDHWRQHAPNVPMIGMVLPDSPTWVDALFFWALGQVREGFGDAADAVALVEAERDRFATWALGCEANFRHRELMLSAELARVRGHEREAMSLYAQAIDAAVRAEHTVMAGVANELYARFWLGLQQKQLAGNFIREAYFHYRIWGAEAKCRQMETEWAYVTFRVVPRRESLASSGLKSTGTDPGGLLDLGSLLKASQALSSQIQVDKLLPELLRLVLENAGAERGAIVSVDDEVCTLELLGSVGAGRSLRIEPVHQPLSAQSLASEPLPVTLLNYVRLTRNTLMLSHPARDERFARSPYLSQRQPRSLMCLPVLTQGRLVALVYLENNQLEDAFTVRQQRTLEMLSAQAAISMVNARLYESLEDKVAQRTEELRLMSMRDGLTQIANRRAFDERLALEWGRSQRMNQPLTLLLIDIDHFKQFNDHYGHVEGDRCIQLVAQALSQVAVRSSDLVARYGGEEFAILLPQTDGAAAARVARACLDAMTQRAVPHAQSAVSGVVTLSIGHASWVAGSDQAAESLIRAADEALYQAKREGRNRSVAAPTPPQG